MLPFSFLRRRRLGGGEAEESASAQRLEPGALLSGPWFIVNSCSKPLSVKGVFGKHNLISEHSHSTTGAGIKAQLQQVTQEEADRPSINCAAPQGALHICSPQEQFFC